MERTFPEGIPQEHDYKELIASDSFKEMEGFSDNFLSANKDILREYMNKWVADPLHQWSRQWEYPFVYDKLKEMIGREPSPRILDAGSGVTFFPYYLCQSGAATVYCCDYDNSLATIYQQINENRDEDVKFSTADLRSLPYDDQFFHMIYCISVLEHTDEYEKIIDEFHRILQPGGRLVVTIDLSLDGTREIDLDRGNLLLSALAKRFAKSPELSLDLRAQVSVPGIFTTLTARDIDPGLLPWKQRSLLRRLKSFIKTGKLGVWPPPLTVFCLSLTKRST